MNDLERAIRYATIVHGDTTDKCGQPFIGHPLRVMAYATADTYGPALVAAVLHDTVEDTETTAEGIGGLFGYEVENLVRVLTRSEGETYREYTRRVAHGPTDGIIVKLADLRDNMDERRVVPEYRKEHEGMIQSRYVPARELLIEELQVRLG